MAGKKRTTEQDLRSEILRLIREPKYRPLDKIEIADALGYGAAQRNEVRRALRDQEEEREGEDEDPAVHVGRGRRGRSGGEQRDCIDGKRETKDEVRERFDSGAGPTRCRDLRGFRAPSGVRGRHDQVAGDKGRKYFIFIRGRQQGAPHRIPSRPGYLLQLQLKFSLLAGSVLPARPVSSYYEIQTNRGR